MRFSRIHKVLSGSVQIVASHNTTVFGQFPRGKGSLRRPVGSARLQPGLTSSVQPRKLLELTRFRMYDLVGKRVRVHLYNREGISVGVVEGRVADVARAVEVADGMKKDLAYVVDITTEDPNVPYKNSSGEENESWFALQDIEVIDNERPRIFTN